MSNLKVMLCTAVSVIGTAISEALGGWTSDMTTLLIFMSVDFVMGLIIAVVFQKSPKTQSGAVDSKSCFKGLCKKCIMLLFVLIAYRLDLSLGVNYIKTAVIIGFITNELISIIENAGIMGVPLPEPIIKSVELLKGKGDRNA